jgi:hypothetical protein
MNDREMLDSIIADLENMGVSDDAADINGARAVEYLAALYADLLIHQGGA